MVRNMAQLFSGCKKLVTLNLLNFNTSSVVNMDSMFKECYSLTSLNLSNFNTTLVTNMKYMFFSCNKLTSLNLSNFRAKSLIDIDYIFYDCKNLEYINMYHFYEGKISHLSDMFHGVKENIIYCIKKEVTADHIISQISLKKCSINDCSSDWKSKRKKMVYKKNICLNSCLEDKTYKYEYDFYCYDKCPVGSHSSKDNIYICENNIFECVAKYPFIVINDKSCKEDCYCDEFFDNICTINSINEESKSILIRNIINGIQEGLIDNLIENYIIKKNMNIIKIVNNTQYQITSSFNQNPKDSNISTLELGDCENKLKDIYNIPKKDPLIIFKTEQYFEGLLIPLIEYEVFHPITKKKLNLDYCKKENINVTITIPVSINEEYLFKYDPNSTYYNNICCTYTTEDKTDIALYDRQNEFNQNSMSLCSNNCIYDGYDSIYKRAICHCKVKERISLNSEIDKNELIFKFDNKKYLTNFNVL
jgi:surface protein